MTEPQDRPRGLKPSLDEQVEQLMADPRFIRELQDEHLVPMLASYAAEPPREVQGAHPKLRDLGSQAMADPAFLARLQQHARGLAESWLELESEAKQVIVLLGYDPAPGAVEAYRRFFLRPVSLVVSDPDEVDQTLKEDLARATREKGAHPNLAESLPASDESPSPSAEAKRLALTPAEREEWLTSLRSLVAVRLIHEKALLVRDRYLRLCKVERFPSKEIFSEALAGHVRWLQRQADADRAMGLDRSVGESAAESSKRALIKYKALLEEAQSALRPRGSYLRPRTAPSQLRIRREVAHSLRLKLGDHGSELARSRAIAAAFSLFGGGLKFVSYGGLSMAALNAVQRERNRLSQELVQEIGQRLSEALRRREWIRKLE